MVRRAGDAYKGHKVLWGVSSGRQVEVAKG
jgi:hypothetical protein